MPANTPNRSYTYATSGDANDLALISQRLAEQVDADVAALYGSVNAQIPAGRVVRTTAHTVNNSTWTEISAFSNETYRRGGISYVSPRLVVPRAGLYLFTAQGTFSVNTSGRRGVAATINGTGAPANDLLVPQVVLPTAATAPTIGIASPLLLNVGDAVGVQFYQDSTAAQSVTSCFFSLTWLGV